jgi:hypothetical protein
MEIKKARAALTCCAENNAAQNILVKALACTLGHRETSSSEENASALTDLNSSLPTEDAQAGWMKEEPPVF